MVINIITTSIVILSSILCIKLYKRIQKHNKIKEAMSKVGASKSHWFWGHLKEFKGVKNTLETQAEKMKKFPKAQHRWLGPVIGSVNCYWPSIIEKILNSGAPRNEFMYAPLRPWLGTGLALVKGKEWERNRKMLNPIFHTEMLKKYLEVFNETTNVLIKKWKSKEKVEVYTDINLFTFDALVQCAMSLKTNCQEEEGSSYMKAIEQMLNIVVKRISNPLLSNDFILSLTSTGKEQTSVLKVLHGYTSAAVRKRKNDTKKDDQRDFLSILLQARDEKGKGMSDLQIQYELNTFLFAGSDTPGSALAWILYNLAKYANYQDKCRAEAQKVLVGREIVTWDDLSKLPYLTMCIKESLRLFPPAYGISRTLSEPLKFDRDFMDDQYNTGKIPKENSSQTFPTGTNMDINIFNIHRNPNLWKDAKQFDPTRFTKENENKIQPYAYVPFAGGPRDCIGQNFARSLIKVALVRLLTHFKFSLDTNFPEPAMTPVIVLKTKNGIHLIIERI